MTIRYKQVGSTLSALALALLLSLQSAAASESAARKKKKSRRAARVTRVDCATTTEDAVEDNATDTPRDRAELTTLLSSLISKGEQLLGKPYRATGIAPWALDCSGYVCYLYKQLGISIPRSSAALSTYTERVDEPKAGDLIFFKGRNAAAQRVGHVALVVSNTDGDPVIMHSTTSRGIVKHRLSKVAYFSKRYLFAGRLPQISELLRGDDNCDNT